MGLAPSRVLTEGMSFGSATSQMGPLRDGIGGFGGEQGRAEGRRGRRGFGKVGLRVPGG